MERSRSKRRNIKKSNKTGPKADLNSKIKTFIRVRPMSQLEVSKGAESCVAFRETDSSVYITKTGKTMILSGAQNSGQSSLDETVMNPDILNFSFDTVFGPKSTQNSIFEKAAKPAVSNLLKGYNSSIFAFGSTGTGKTYTISGYGEQKGLLPRILERVLSEAESLRKSNKTCEVSLSFLEIYNEELFDLGIAQSKRGQKSAVKLRQDANKSVFVEGLTETPISSVGEGERLIQAAASLRSTSQTRMSVASSRSHMVYTIKLIVQVDKNSKKSNFQEAVLNLVDLAGSEWLKLSETTQGKQMKEAIKINLSLTTLSRVIKKLSAMASAKPNQKKKEFVPYRDSKLTFLMKESLGGNCVTYFIGCLTQSSMVATQSLATLRFISHCKVIKTKPKLNIKQQKQQTLKRLLVANYRSSSSKKGSMKNKPKKVLPPWKGKDPELSDYILKTSEGPLRVIDNNINDPKNNRLIIMMHGCPSECTNLYHFFIALTHYKYRVVGFDFKGYGGSPGSPLASRSDKIHIKGGPADCALAVMKALGYKSAIFGGYDWGAGVAIGLALKHPKKVKSVLSFLPSYNPSSSNELKTVTPRCLIMWVKQDLLHSWKRWKSLAAQLPNKKIELIDIKRYQDGCSSGAYAKYSDEISRRIVMFLGYPDPFLSSVETQREVRMEEVDVDGKKFEKKQLIVFQGDPALSKMNQDGEDGVSGGPELAAVRDFCSILKNCVGSDSKYKKLVKDVLGGSKAVKDVIRVLPGVTPEELYDDPTIFVKFGIWKGLPKNLLSMWQSPRYFQGRKVLCLLPTNPELSSHQFLKYCPNQNSEEFLISGFRIESINKHAKTFTIKDADSHQLEVPFTKVINFGHPQKFSYTRTQNPKLILEDGFRCDYSSPLIKSKVIEMAWRLREIVQKLDFKRPKTEILDLQRQAVYTIRSCLNLKSFCNGVDHARCGRTDDIGQLSWNGQANCRGLSSTISPYLYLFGSVLGIDVMYRAGYSFSGMSSGEVSNQVDKHQWVQIALRPSMEEFVVDLWYEDQEQDSEYVCMGLDKAMRCLSVPHPRVILQNKIFRVEDSDFSSSQ